MNTFPIAREEVAHGCHAYEHATAAIRSEAARSWTVGENDFLAINEERKKERKKKNSCSSLSERIFVVRRRSVLSRGRMTLPNDAPERTRPSDGQTSAAVGFRTSPDSAFSATAAQLFESLFLSVCLSLSLSLLHSNRRHNPLVLNN